MISSSKKTDLGTTFSNQSQMAEAMLDLESSDTIHCTHPDCDYSNRPSFSWPYSFRHR